MPVVVFGLLNKYMVKIKLTGGLGNQMFQYVMARAVAIRNNTDLDLDISWFKKIKGNTSRKYNLDDFNIKGEIIETSLFSKIKSKIYFWELNKPYSKRKFIKEEKIFNFNPEILKISGDVYIEGYWQSEKYFKDIEDVIRKDFTLKDKFSDIGENLKKQILNCEAVSLHIRRGDYLSNAEANNFHGLCSLDYYNKAVSIISEKVKDPVFFIFSDDIEWVKENLKINFPMIFIENSFGLKDTEELILMSLCKHYIIANSSFSWWGAWLGNNKNKLVLSPKKWVNDNNIEVKDLIPNEWILI